MAVDLLLGSDERAEWVIVQAHALKVEGTDLIIDAAERRLSAQPDLRRALVHDSSDGLTVNFNNDYPAGVTLNGVASITPLKVEPMPPGTHSSKLIVHGDIEFQTVEMSIAHGGAPTIVSVSLHEKIAALEAKIAALVRRLDALHG